MGIEEFDDQRIFLARFRQVGIATELLNRGADPNAADDYHRAALFAAIDLRNFNHEKYGDLPTDGRDPLDLINALRACVP